MPEITETMIKAPKLTRAQWERTARLAEDWARRTGCAPEELDDVLGAIGYREYLDRIA